MSKFIAIESPSGTIAIPIASIRMIVELPNENGPSGSLVCYFDVVRSKIATIRTADPPFKLASRINTILG